MKLSQTFTEGLKKLELLILDVDGVMTDGRITYGSDGVEYKSFDVHDGMGIASIISCGVRVAIISARESSIVQRRASELGIEDCLQGYPDKIEAYKALVRKYNFTRDQIAYMGDDVNDIPVMNHVGIKIAVANARTEVKKVADYVTSTYGGQGAVREVTDLILKAKRGDT